MKFELVSNHKPAGDQPAATKVLVEGLEKGYKHQTLLGVTGSGKSVTGNTDVLIKRNGIVCVVKIGELIDELLEKDRGNIKRAGDTEILNRKGNKYDLEVYSINPLTKKSDWKKVRQYTRHASPKLYEVVTRCGRSITVTGDHNFYVLRSGVLTLVETANVKTSDYVPIPRHLPEPKNFISSIEFLKYISNPEKFFVYLPSSFIGRGNYKKKMYSLFGSSKVWRVLKEGERLNMSNYITLASFLPDVERKAKFGYKIKNYQFSHLQDLTPLFLKFLGYYIAEGHATAGYLILSSDDKEIISDVHQFCRQYDFHVRLRPDSCDYQISSRVWAEVMRNMCGSHSQTKKLPDFWLQLSNKQLGLLLSAYFSGDGGVDGQQVTCTTASEQLASNIQYALLRFGIIARVRKRKIRVPNKDYKNQYWTITMSGQKDLATVSGHISFSIGRKRKKLVGLLGKDANTNVDLVPVSSEWLADVRMRCSLSQSDVAVFALTGRSHISLLESGKRKPSREVFRRVVRGFKEKAKKEKLFSVYGEIVEQEKLLEVFWSPVRSIRENNKKNQYVYDFAVSDNETFLAGSGGLFVHNTFTVANVIAEIQKPTLVIAHNKTLAAQLTNEFRELFPKNSVNYFVSYYDYYQPEAYLPSSDTYIDKEALINDEIDKLRHAATMALLTRRDVIVVASVSCIYGLGAPEAYAENIFHFKIGDQIDRKSFMRKLIELQFTRTNSDLKRGTYRLRGDSWEIMPPDREVIYAFELGASSTPLKAGGEKVIRKIYEVNPVEGFVPEKTPTLDEVFIAPAKHFVTPKEEREQAILAIEAELRERLKYFEANGKLLEAERLERRTRFDLAMMREIGYCHGIENYSRHLSGRAAGVAPDTLLDYFVQKRGPTLNDSRTNADKDFPRKSASSPRLSADDGFLTIIDESHITIPQIQGMYAGDRSRKKTLVEYGFRLPSAVDNRPLMFEEFEKRIGQRIYTSATPGPYEKKTYEGQGSRVKGQVVEQIIRPTGLVDPKITIRPARGQVADLIPRIEERVKIKERVLVTTLTKKMAEELSVYLEEKKIKVTYLHSDIKTLDRIRILTNLRKGSGVKGGFDVLVGVNLLREGLDLPEVSLVAILDADKEGFLRSETSLVQTIGRAARNVNGEVLMYADQITGSIKRAVSETDRRRNIQLAYNAEHGITPTTIIKKISDILPDVDELLKLELAPVPKSKSALQKLVAQKTKEMREAAAHLDFELAALLRDEIKAISKKALK